MDRWFGDMMFDPVTFWRKYTVSRRVASFPIVGTATQFNAENIIRNLISPAYYSFNMKDELNSLPQHRLMIRYTVPIQHLADQIIEELPI